jgi:hypothetical protein
MSPIEIDSLRIKKTYGGSLEGLPEAQGVIDRAKKEASSCWGPRAVFVIPPATIVIEAELPFFDQPQLRLPEWQYFVWCNSYAPTKNEDADGSELVVVYWSEQMEIPNITTLMSMDDWKNNAKDFWV